jgi:hypothetical protein
MILQFAKIPPPIGGITIHVKRLVDSINKLQSEKLVDILDYARERKLKIIFLKIYKAKIVHIHLSRQSHRLFFIIFFKFLLKKVVVTFHGKKDFSNKFDYLSLIIANRAIVLNQGTYDKAIKITKSVYLIGAFIPPTNKIMASTIKPSTLVEIEKLKKNYKFLFSTNAFKVVFDDNNEEIYGGSLMIKIFSEFKDIALVFSDPTGDYKSFLIKKYKVLPENVYFIDYIHDFIEIIKLSDCTIRATTTDGDPLSVKESLFFTTNVICSNVVDRPKGVITYKSENDLKEIINNYSNYGREYLSYSYEDNVSKIMNIYKSF